MADRGFADRRQRGARGGVKKRMAVGGMPGLGPMGPGPMRSYPRPMFLSSANAVPVPYGMPPRPYGGVPPNPSGKYGFFESPQGFGPPGYEKRSEAALKSSGNREGVPKPLPPIPSLIRPPGPVAPLSRAEASSPGKDGLSLVETGTEGMNELFAKMVWKKLDLIKDSVRLSRLHIEIMNILQMAIAEETTQPRE